MMRHPNNPTLIFIIYFSRRGDYHQDYSAFLFDDKTQSESSFRGFSAHGRIDKADAKFLVKQYKKIETLTEIGDGEVLFVEFGYEPFALYQARPFKRIETADFKVPSGDYDKTISSNLVFGITPEEGIVLPVLRSFGLTEVLTLRNDITGLERGRGVQFNGADGMLRGELYNGFYSRNPERYCSQMLREWNLKMDDAMKGERYCLMMSSAHREKYDVDLSVPNLGAMVVDKADNFMVHGMMRLIKKADITIASGRLLIGNRLFSTIESLEGRVRIFSNGREGVVFRE